MDYKILYDCFSFLTVPAVWPVLEILNSRNRVGIGLSYRLAGLHTLAELIPWNRLLGSLKISKLGLWFLYFKVNIGGMHSKEYKLS
jgi:hypothetical protein